MLTIFIEQLIRGQNLSYSEAQTALTAILEGADPCQIAAFLILLRAKHEAAEEIQGMVEGMRQRMQPLQNYTTAVDIVGTGGDGAHTVNISTAASILTASCGVPVIKHGNRAVSSLSGSADVLEACGIRIEMTPEEVNACVAEVGIGFCFAPLFHPALKIVKPIRTALKVPTIFNLLGPLLNPAQVPYLLLGVAKEEYLALFAKVLCQLKIKRALIVYSEGIDEMTLLGPSLGIEVAENSLQPFHLDPREYGFSYCQLADLQGGNPILNAKRLFAVFSGEKSPLADTIALNAAVALYLVGKTSSIQSGLELAQQQLNQGAALQLLQRWQQFSLRRRDCL